MDYREEAEVQNIKQRFGIIGISPKINNVYVRDQMRHEKSIIYFLQR
ncbi:hypothetical protein OAF88_03435 [Cyclobacteriaceae bacterium]|nr:hypothetical protein [Cyclobacteriaceae bacterium]